MKWLKTIALNFGTCCHNKSFNNIELLNKILLIHQTVLEIRTKIYFSLYKDTTKNPPYGDNNSVDQFGNKHQYQKNSFFGMGLQKMLGWGSNYFSVGGMGDCFFLRGV